MLAKQAAALAGLFVALGAALARAQAPGEEASAAASEQARHLYESGAAAFAESHFVEAARRFEAAAALRPSANALYTAGLSWESAGERDRAADDYARSLALPGLAAADASYARDRLAGLEKALATLTVSGDEGSFVRLDALAEAPVPASLHGTAGAHTLTIRDAAGNLRRFSVAMAAGATLVFEVPPPASAPSTTIGAASPATPAAVDFHRTAPVALFAVGGTAVLAGILLGVEALDAEHAFDQAPSRAGYDHATELATWTNVAFATGAVLSAGAVALLLWPPRSPASVATAPHLTVTGVGLRGAF